MKANIHFYVPQIHKLTTGGNLFNRMMIKHLSATMPVSVKVVNSSSEIRGDSVSGSVHVAHESHIAIIDSLLLESFDQMELSKLKGERGKLLLIVHYLDLIDPNNASSARSRQQKNLLPHFDGFIVTSQYSRNMLIKNGIALGKISVISPGIDPLFRSTLQRQNDGAAKILTVSSLINGKGLIELLSDLEELTDLNWTWQIVGETRLDGKFSAFFREKIQTSTIQSRIKLTGVVEQKSLLKIYSESDVFVLPSEFESCSMVTMEAMAAGLPILARAVGGIPELVRDNENGFLITNFNQHNFRQALARLLQDAELRQKFGISSHFRSRKFSSWDESMLKLESFLNTFVSSPQIS